ncbi:MAG: TMEM175 family protein [Chloroflexota bacterium]
MTAARDLFEASDARETGRLEAFSDGVFAIAITLLVLALAVPKLGSHASAASLRLELGKEWPSYFSFVTSFATILIMWINHHEVFRLVARVNTMLLFANGVLLLFVTIVPFPTALLGDYLGTPAAVTACAVYAALFALTNIAYNFLWWTIRRKDGVLKAGVPEEHVRAITRSYAFGFPPYVIATAVAFWNPYISIGICFCLWILWGASGHSHQAHVRKLTEA